MTRLCGLLLGVILATSFGCSRVEQETEQEITSEEIPLLKTEAELAEEALRAYDMGIEKGISEVDVYLLAKKLGDPKFDHVSLRESGIYYTTTTHCNQPGSSSTAVYQLYDFSEDPVRRGLFYLDCNDNGWIDNSEMQRGNETLKSLKLL